MQEGPCWKLPDGARQRAKPRGDTGQPSVGGGSSCSRLCASTASPLALGDPRGPAPRHGTRHLCHVIRPVAPMAGSCQAASHRGASPCHRPGQPGALASSPWEAAPGPSILLGLQLSEGRNQLLLASAPSRRLSQQEPLAAPVPALRAPRLPSPEPNAAVDLALWRGTGPPGFLLTSAQAVRRSVKGQACGGAGRRHRGATGGSHTRPGWPRSHAPHARRRWLGAPCAKRARLLLAPRAWLHRRVQPFRAGAWRPCCIGRGALQVRATNPRHVAPGAAWPRGTSHRGLGRGTWQIRTSPPPAAPAPSRGSRGARESRC